MKPELLRWINSAGTSNISTHWYSRFTGKSKTFKKNKRRGL